MTDVTLFSSGRVKIVPFQRHFAEEERDEGLKEELSRPENLSGILNWCLEGLWLIDETGFDPPESVRAVTEDYRQSNDRMGRFLKDEMVKTPGAETPMVEIYQRYQDWCAANGYKYENNSNFKRALEGIGPIARARPAGSGRAANPISLFYGYELIPRFTHKFISD